MHARKLAIVSLTCFIVNVLHVYGVALSTICSQHHLTCSINQNRITLKNAKHYFSFTLGNKEAFLDHTKVYLTYPIIENVVSQPTLFKRIGRKIQKILHTTNGYEIDSVDYQKYILPILHPENIQKKSGKVIVIDPGHGGKAHGAINQKLGIKEKDIALKLALQLKQKLKQKGYTVHLTRDRDREVALEERSAFAKRVKGDVFISLHFNSAPSLQASGIETFAYTFAHCPSTDRLRPNLSDKKTAPVNHWDAASTWLAYCLQKNLIGALGVVDRGVRRGRMKVLEGLNCPGILIEGGFISHPTEAQKIKSLAYQHAFIDAIACGLATYFKASQNKPTANIPLPSVRKSETQEKSKKQSRK